MCFEGIRSMRNEDILSLPWGRVTENTGPNPCQMIQGPHPLLIYKGRPAHQKQAHQSVSTS
jgi:hypothetical protein